MSVFASQYEIAVQPWSGNGHIKGLSEAMVGTANPSALTARIPKIDKPRMTSRDAMRAFVLTGASTLSVARANDVFASCSRSQIRESASHGSVEDEVEAATRTRI